MLNRPAPERSQVSYSALRHRRCEAASISYLTSERKKDSRFFPAAAGNAAASSISVTPRNSGLRRCRRSRDVRERVVQGPR